MLINHWLEAAYFSFFFSHVRPHTQRHCVEVVCRATASSKVVQTGYDEPGCIGQLNLCHYSALVLLEVWLWKKAMSNVLIRGCVPVATATHMIPAPDKDVRRTVDHCEVIVLEGFVLLINVPDFQTLKNIYQQPKVSRCSQQKFRSCHSRPCIESSPHKTMWI